MNEHVEARNNTRGVKNLLKVIEDLVRGQQKEGKIHEHDPTPSEIFAVIQSVLPTFSDVSVISDTLQIFETVIHHTFPSIIRSQFTNISTVLLAIAREHNDNKRLLRICLSTLGEILCSQDTSNGFWGGILALQSVNALLAYIDDTRVKLRKNISSKLVKLLSIHKKNGSSALRSYVTDFCIEIMKKCTRSDYRRSLFIVIFLESGGALLDVERLFLPALRLQESSQPVLTAAVFRMIDALFQNPYFNLTENKLNECLQKLIEMRPSIADMESNVFYYTSLASGLVQLSKTSPILLSSLLPKAISTLLNGCETDFVQIHCAVGTALKRIIYSCINDDMIKDAKEKIGTFSSSDNILSNIITSILPILQLKYQSSWVFALDGLKSLYVKMKFINGAGVLLDRITVTLAEIYQAIDSQAIVVGAGIEASLLDTIGTSVQSIGFVHFITIFPIRTIKTPHFGGIDFEKQWVLALLQNNLKYNRCSLNDFITIILDIARTCSNALKGKSPQGVLLEYQMTLARKRIIQLWSLFPEFCYQGPVDVPVVFPRLSKILVSALQDKSYPELFDIVTSGLTALLHKARERCPLSSTIDSADVQILKSHADQFLPILLTYLENPDIQEVSFHNGVQCIAGWVSVSSAPLVSALFKKLLESLLSTTSASGEGLGSVYLAVVLSIIPVLPTTLITLLYRTVCPLLSIQESLSLQKRSYAVLESLLKNHRTIIFTNETQTTPLSLLITISESLLLSHVSARHMRLRCIAEIMNILEGDDLLLAGTSVLGEMLICQKDSNKKSRETAVSVLRLMMKKCPPKNMLTQLCSALVAETTLMRSSAIIGVCVLLLEQRQDEWLMSQIIRLLPTVIMLLHEESTEQTRAVLTFLRVVVTVTPSDDLVTSTPLIVDATLNKLGPHKSKFSSRIRAILRKLSQKVSEDLLKPLIQETDQALLQYIQKQARRIKRKKESRDEIRLRSLLGPDGDDNDGDSSDDDDDEEDTNSNHNRGGGGSRTRAMRSTEVENYTTMPMTLDELLEDQPASFVQRSSIQKVAKPTVAIKENRLAGLVANEDNDDDSDDEFDITVSADGRIVIKDKQKKNENTGNGSSQGNDHINNNGKKIDSSSLQKDNNQDKSLLNNSKKRKLKEPGEEYRSKKAGGDVWRRGMLEPHAFIPLDGRLLSKKNHREAVSHFGVVVKNGKKKTKTTGVAPKGRNNKVDGQKRNKI